MDTVNTDQKIIQFLEGSLKVGTPRALKAGLVYPGFLAGFATGLATGFPESEVMVCWASFPNDEL